MILTKLLAVSSIDCPTETSPDNNTSPPSSVPESSPVPSVLGIAIVMSDPTPFVIPSVYPLLVCVKVITATATDKLKSTLSCKANSIAFATSAAVARPVRGIPYPIDPDTVGSSPESPKYI